jgi:hypothetical protein
MATTHDWTLAKRFQCEPWLSKPETNQYPSVLYLAKTLQAGKRGPLSSTLTKLLVPQRFWSWARV